MQNAPVKKSDFPLSKASLPRLPLIGASRVKQESVKPVAGRFSRNGVFPKYVLPGETDPAKEDLY